MTRTLAPDLILIELNMSGQMNGITAAEKITTESDVQVVFLIGDAKKEEIERANKISSIGCIQKPFQAGQVAAAIENAFYHHKEHRLSVSLKNI